MIVGTAGHIDHGKTTLVKALTGVDTDRLPQEKARGISIELGYAFLDLPAPPGAAPGEAPPRIGFIDVPGHERLVHTMLAGATGIDHALLLVAADDGVMPQTREHLAVLSLLGLAQGTVVLTKADRADAARLEAVRGEVAQLLAPTPLAAAPVLAVSATTGDGLPALRTRLAEAAAAARRAADPQALFRLAIDRVFSLDGIGTVVTGTVHAGAVEVGDELCLVPGDAGTVVRVRSLHAQNRPVTRAAAGQRCALNLAGLARERIARGQWLVAPGAAVATGRIDVQLRLWHAEPRALRSGTPVRVHLGAESVEASVAVLDGEAIAPGASARVQLVLRQPVGAWIGDRVVLRDASASRTLAGGVVIDPGAPARYRRTPQRLAELEALAEPDAAAGEAALVAAAPHGVDLARLARLRGRWRDPAAPAWALGDAQSAALREKVLATLRDFHARAPDEAGPEAMRLRRLAAPRLPEPLWREQLAGWLATGLLGRSGGFVQLPDHGSRLSALDQRIADKVRPILARGVADGVWARDLARDTQEPEALMRTTLARLAQRGELHQVVRDLCYDEATLRGLARLARGVAEAHGGEVTAAGFRDATGLGRKRAIQILEYFDRIGLLRRVGDVHRLRRDTALFGEDEA